MKSSQKRGGKAENSAESRNQKRLKISKMPAESGKTLRAVKNIQNVKRLL